MRVIINDRRYGALKTLGEKKQAFNEVNLHMDDFQNEVLVIYVSSLVCLKISSMHNYFMFLTSLAVCSMYILACIILSILCFSSWVNRRNSIMRRGVLNKKKHGKNSRKC